MLVNEGLTDELTTFVVSESDKTVRFVDVAIFDITLVTMVTVKEYRLDSIPKLTCIRSFSLHQARVTKRCCDKLYNSNYFIK